jgi:hypothetical protein
VSKSSPGPIIDTEYIPALRVILNVAPFPEVELDTTPYASTDIFS